MSSASFVLLGEVVVNLLTGAAVGPRGRSNLTPKELATFRYLYDRRGLPVSRKELMVAVWGYHERARSRTVDITVGRLRKKLQLGGDGEPLITTVHGVGYRLEGRPSALSDTRDTPEAPPVDVAGVNRRWFGDRSVIESVARILEQERRAVLIGLPGAGKSRLAYEVGRFLRVPMIWVPMHGATSSEEIAAQLFRVAGRTTGTSRELLGAVAGLDPDVSGKLLVLDDLGCLEPAAARTLDVIAASTRGPRLLLTARVDPNLRSAPTLRVEPLSVEHAEALLLDELGYRRLPFQVSRGPTTRAWVEEADCLPGSIIMAARQVQSRAHFEAGPKTVDLRVLPSPICGEMEEEDRDFIRELAAFPQGITWEQARSLWPEALPRLSRALGMGTAIERGERILCTRMLARCVKPSSSALLRWAMQERPRMDQVANLEAALGVAETSEQRVQILSVLGSLLDRKGAFEEHLRQIVVALGSSELRACDVVQLQLARASCHLELGQPHRAWSALQEARRFGGEPDLRMHGLSALSLQQIGEPSEEYLALATDAAQTAEERTLAAYFVAEHRLFELRYAEAAAASLEGLSAGCPVTPLTIRLRVARAVALMGQGREDAVGEVLDEAGCLAASLDEPYLATFVELVEGEIELLRGHVERARTFFERVAGRAQSCPSLHARVLCNLGLIALEAETVEEGRARIKQALVVGEKLQSPGIIGRTLVGLGLCFHGEGALAAALDHYERGLARLGPNPWLRYPARAFAALARWQLGGDPVVPEPPQSGVRHHEALHAALVHLMDGAASVPVDSLLVRLASRFSRVVSRVAEVR